MSNSACLSVHYLLPPVKVSNSQMVFGSHVHTTSTKQKFPSWTKFHPVQHIKEVLDCFRLDLLLLVFLVLLLVCKTACVFFFKLMNLLSRHSVVGYQLCCMKQVSLLWMNVYVCVAVCVCLCANAEIPLIRN